MAIVFRALNERDSIFEMTELLHAAYAALSKLGFNYTAVDQSEDVTRSRIKNAECTVACDGERLVGTITLYAHPYGDIPWYANPGVAVVGQFAVDPAYQHRGIGRTLMERAEERAESLGKTELALDTAEGASRLIGWYVRLGYRPVAYVQHAGKTYRSVILSKTLTGKVRTSR